MKKIFFLSIFVVSLVCGLGQTANASVVDSTVEINDATPNGPALSDSDFYGISLDNMGDLNGDGVNDLVVGASGDDAGAWTWDRGAIYISFMNSNGSVISTKKIDETTSNGPALSDWDMYGISVTQMGDLDNDGVTDIAVGAFGDDGGGTDRGAVYIHFMNSNTSIKKTVKINENDPSIFSADNDFYGRSVENIGDLNGDGVNDLAVGIPNHDSVFGTNNGAIYIHFMKADGTINSSVLIDEYSFTGSLNDSDFYGTSITNIGDLNGDGVNDLVVGASGDDTGGSNRGAIYIHYMRSDGIILSTVKIDSNTANGPVLNNEDSYGISVDNMGDLNGDGVNDLVVGAYQDKEGPNKKGTVYIHYMKADGSIISTKEINGMTPNGPALDNDDNYGWEVANIGDFNGDKTNDLAVGAYLDNNNGGVDRGTVHIHFLTDTRAPVVSEVTAVPSPTSDTTPEYTFNTDEAGTIEYGGGCSSATTTAVLGNNTITFNPLTVGIYNSCTIRVTDAKSNASAPLTISPFEISSLTPIFRLYNTRTGTQLYTRGEADKNKILNKFRDFVFTDGVPAFYASLTDDGNTPIYRLYNTRTGAQLYTRGEADKNKILNKFKDFKFTDGTPAFYASLSDDGSTPIYRLYNKRTGMQLYTRGEADKNKILNKYKDFVFTDGTPAFYASLTN